MDVPQRILEELAIISAYGMEGNDWMLVKKQLLLSLPSSLRKNFSTRHPQTKKQTVNEFEASLIDIYEGMTGVKLRLKNE
tara:strand:- start:24 stop:263 length:240 start_codon:yes stop_codon:yes gene_type:complete